MISEIKERCKKANAIILAHYYQAPEIQEIADFIGDSLDLSRKAANNDADIIIFCGVHFKAETAKILSPNKTVLLPDIDAGCSLADDCPSDKFQKFREENPDHYVVSYINCTAEVLPWQLGAKFFFKYLFDGDASSNLLTFHERVFS